jgi:hypothetical protein
VVWHALVVLLALPYALLNFSFPGPLLTYSLGLGIALLSVLLLYRAGVRLTNPFRTTLPSLRGGLLLTIPLLYLPAAAAIGRSQPVGGSELLFGVCSGVAQELYFRYSLIVGLEELLPRHIPIVLGLQAALFGLWHARAFAVVGVLPALAVVGGTAIAGLLWGLEAHRDRTILYAAAEHSLLLIVQ